MSRNIIKTVSNESEEFVPEDQRDLSKDSKELKDVPMIFIGKRTNRDQQWIIRDMLELKDPKNSDRGVKGMGDAFKYMWKHLISEVRNVCEVGDSYRGDAKDALWDTAVGMDKEMDEAITYFYTKSALTDDEVKT